MFRLYTTLFFLTLVGPLSGLDYHFDEDALFERLESPDIAGYSVSSGTFHFDGVSLLELLPLMEDVYDFELHTDDGRFTSDDDDIAEYWAESYLTQTGNSLDLLYRGKLFRNLREIHFSGTPMESRALEIWLAWEGTEELKRELARFGRLHQLDIRGVEVSSPDSKLVSVVRARGEVPDIVMIQSSAVDKLVRNRALQSLGYLKLPKLNQTGLDAFSMDSRLMAVPFYFDTQIFLYNDQLLSAPGQDSWFLSDLEQMVESIREDGKHPMAWNAYSSNWLIPFQMAFGKDHLLETDGSIRVDDAPTTRALDYIVELQDRELLVPMERDAMDALFISGRVGLIMTGSYSIPYFESLGIPFAVLPFPVEESTGRALSPLLDYKGFAITRQAKSPILARRVIQYLVGIGVQQRFCPELAKLPSRNDVLEISGTEFSNLDILRDAAASGTVIPPQQIYSIYKNNMWKLLRFALSHRMSVEQTLEEGQKLMDNSMMN